MWSVIPISHPPNTVSRLDPWTLRSLSDPIESPSGFLKLPSDHVVAVTTDLASAVLTQTFFKNAFPTSPLRFHIRWRNNVLPEEPLPETTSDWRVTNAHSPRVFSAGPAALPYSFAASWTRATPVGDQVPS